MCYSQNSATLLVCAALPNYDRRGNVEYFGGNILVLPHVSQIIPLFLMDFSSHYDVPDCTHHWYPSDSQLQTIQFPKEKEPMMFPKQMLRKILSHINHRTRKNERYQLRLVD